MMVLGMVDVVVGGKIGINIVEGKNLVGVFWVLCVVLCDLDVFDMFSKNEILVGYVEIVKVGFIVEFEILDIIEVDVDVVIDLMML